MSRSGWLKGVFIPWFTSLGLTSRTVTLEVTGRKTGNPRRMSLSRTEYGGRQFFVSLAGESEWVRNVRAAGGNAVLISRKRYPIRLVEIAAELRAPVMLAYVQRRAFTHSGAQSARHFFGLGANPTLMEMQALAEKYVVLEILPRDLQG